MPPWACRAAEAGTTTGSSLDYMDIAPSYIILLVLLQNIPMTPAKQNDKTVSKGVEAVTRT
jgi:hypothetical protein